MSTSTDYATWCRVYGMADGVPHGMRGNLIAYALPKKPDAVAPFHAAHRPTLRAYLLDGIISVPVYTRPPARGV